MVNGVFTACLCPRTAWVLGKLGSDSEGLGGLVWLIAFGI